MIGDPIFKDITNHALEGLVGLARRRLDLLPPEEQLPALLAVAGGFYVGVLSSCFADHAPLDIKRRFVIEQMSICKKKILENIEEGH